MDDFNGLLLAGKLRKSIDKVNGKEYIKCRRWCLLVSPRLDATARSYTTKERTGIPSCISYLMHVVA